MTAEVAEQLEDIRIELEVASLQEAELLPYLQRALEMWGVPYTADTLDALAEEAAQALEAEALEEAARRGPDGKFIRGSGSSRRPASRSTSTASEAPSRSSGSSRSNRGRKMTGSLLNRLGKFIGRAAVKGVAYVAGKAAQGTGRLLSKAKNRKLRGAGNFIKRSGSRLATAAANI